MWRRKCRMATPTACGGGIDGVFAVIPETVRSTVIRNPYSLTVVMDSGFASGACHRAGHFGPDPLARAPE
jgi:hypothetical protein